MVHMSGLTHEPSYTHVYMSRYMCARKAEGMCGLVTMLRLFSLWLPSVPVVLQKTIRKMSRI